MTGEIQLPQTDGSDRQSVHAISVTTLSMPADLSQNTALSLRENDLPRHCFTPASVFCRDARLVASF